MDEDVDDIENEDHFWEEIDDIASTPCRTQDRIDDTLRTWIATITRYRDVYIHAEEHITRCVNSLLGGSLISRHADYVRRQLVYALLQHLLRQLTLQEDEPTTLHLIVTFVLLDGQQFNGCFELLAAEGGFARLVELIRKDTDDEQGLHRRMLVLLYEMSRIQRMSWNDLMTVDDAFVLYLFRIIESLSGDVNDPYHHATIRVLLVLNEQYMVCCREPPRGDTSNEHSMVNRVIRTLSKHGGAYKTFGESIILLLNRESETSLQLLILKLFYLIFTTPSIYEYFYTNDLHVLVDILIRNLLDLPPDSIADNTTTSLRHTYLRVLHPLLAHTQLSHPPFYKRTELRKLLLLLADEGHTHFERPDETTVRLVGRCLAVQWLRDTDDQSSDAASPTLLSPTQVGIKVGQAAVAKKLIGISLPEAQESALSVNEVAMQQAKPGVATPSRAKGTAGEVELEVEIDRGPPPDLIFTQHEEQPVSPESEGDPFRG